MHFTRRGLSLWCLVSLLTLPSQLACASSTQLTVEPHADESVSLSAFDPETLGQKVEIDISACPEFGSIWQFESDGLVDRVGGSDENAVYWIAILPVLEEGKGFYEIRGQYPDARFFSLESYDPNPVDAILDFQIRPERGSSNPFSGRGRGNNREYVVRLNPTQPATLLPNSLFAGDSPDLLNYVLMYRIYDGRLTGEPIPPEFADDPREWQKRGQQDLPKIFYISRRSTESQYQSLQELCSQIIGGGENFNARPAQVGAFLTSQAQLREPDGGRLGNEPPLWFIGTDVSSGLEPIIGNYPLLFNKLQTQLDEGPDEEGFTNVANSYLSTFLNSAYGDVFIARFKAPTVPTFDSGSGQGNKEQVRYWSFCTYNLTLYTGDCLKDTDFETDVNGYANLVVSWPADRPIDPETGQLVNNWLPLTSLATIITYRHQLPSLSFRKSHYYYERTCDQLDRDCFQQYEAIERWMDEYYPHGIYCSTQEFETDRCESRWKNR